MTVRICTVLARGGSKGVPGKNVRDLGGKPLIVHSLDQARQSGLFDVVAVSSDDADILAIADRAGADLLVRRPAEMATDTAPKLPAVRHCVEVAEKERGRRFDTVVDLQPTSPLRLAEDIEAVVALLETGEASNVITGMVAKCSPYFSLVEERPDGTVGLSKPVDPPLARRQDAPPCFDMNGSIYAWHRDVLFAEDRLFLDRTRLYEMPEERSVDIDTELDFEIAALLMRRRGLS